VIVDKSPYLIVSCVVIIDAHGMRLVASIAFMEAHSVLLEHIPLTAASLEGLAHQVAPAFNKLELNNRQVPHRSAT